MLLQGNAVCYGDNVDTDVIIPARYLNTSDPGELAAHCMEDIDPDFLKKIKPGDMPGIVMAAIWKDTGYYALMVLAALKSIDPNYYEAAAIDGAGPGRRFFSITLPLLSPTLFLLVVINVIYGLQVFESVLIMTNGGPGGATTVFLERIYNYAFKQYKMGMVRINRNENRILYQQRKIAPVTPEGDLRILLQ